MSDPISFHLGDVLSITTGKLVSPRRMDGIYDILNFMTGESLFTHQLPRASRACRPALLGQHPLLADVDASEVHDPATADAFLAAQVARFGETVPVSPLLPDAYEAMEPIEELVAMVGRDKVIVVKA